MALLKTSGDTFTSNQSFMLARGPILVPGLQEIYSYDTAPGGRRVLFDLLCTFGKDTVNEAVKRLGDPRSFYVRNLLMLIHRAGTPAVIPAVKPLLRHADPKVRLEALAVLLRLKDPEAVGILRQEISSKDPDVSSAAVFLAGQFRVTEMIDDILGLFKKTILFETDCRQRGAYPRAGRDRRSPGHSRAGKDGRTVRSPGGRGQRTTPTRLPARARSSRGQGLH